jgi:hypothetical protein
VLLETRTTLAAGQTNPTVLAVVAEVALLACARVGEGALLKLLVNPLLLVCWHTLLFGCSA